MEQRSSILLVEDSEDDILLFQRALEDGGQEYDLRSANEAIEYLQRACQGGEVEGYPVPKFIIMDNKMPRVEELLRWISENRIYTVVPTVILSNSDAPKDVKLAFELGVHGFFLKPISKSELSELMRMIFYYWSISSVPIGETN